MSPERRVGPERKPVAGSCRYPRGRRQRLLLALVNDAAPALRFHEATA